MNNAKYPELLYRIYNLITTRQSNSKNVILNRFSMGKVWDEKYKDDNNLFVLTTLKQEESRFHRTNIHFTTLDEVHDFINENWEEIK